MVRLGVAALQLQPFNHWVPGSRFHLYFDSTIIIIIFLRRYERLAATSQLSLWFPDGVVDRSCAALARRLAVR